MSNIPHSNPPLPVSSSTSQPQLSIIIVTWNVRELLRANLARLFSLSSACSFEVFIIDNASHDGTAYMVRNEFPRATLITNAWDAGFAGPNNQALRLAKGEVVILLNPDMLVEEGALDVTYKTLMEDPSIGVMGIKLLGQNGKPINSVRRDPDVWSQLGILLKLPHLFPHLNQRYLYTDFDYERTQDVDHVRGSFFAFRRELLRTVGYLDAGYHLWFEEVDYCKRVRQTGMRIRYVADAFAHDYVGKGFEQMKRLETQRIFSKSMIRYFHKWQPGWRPILLTLARPIGLVAAAGADVWNAWKSEHL